MVSISMAEQFLKTDANVKKFFPYIFITLLVLGGVFGPFGGVQVAEAIPGIPSPGELVERVVNFIAYAFLLLGSWILGTAGLLLDISVKLSITDMKAMVQGLGAVQEGWATFRDIANIFFIFIIIWIAISTILQIDRYGIKQLLAKVIIVALLMNFSLFFTKVIIDASNIVAISFYNAMDIKVNRGGNLEPGGIAAVFMDSFDLTTLYKPSLPTTAAQADPQTSAWRIFLTGIIGFVVMGIAAFIFFVAAGLFIIRFVVLVLLMVLSPLAFLAMILPGANQWSKKWWDTLFQQCLFAPIYMMLIWFVVKVITSGAFKASLRGLQGPSAPSGGPDWGASIADGVATSAITQVFLNFFVVTVFLVAALIIAKSMASSGAPAISAAVDWTTKKAGGVFTRNTVGRAGGLTKRLAGDLGKKMEGSRFAKYTGLNMALRGVKNVGEAGEKMKGIIPGFGDRSRADVREAREKRVEAGIRERRDDPRQLARYMVSLRESERKHAYDKLSTRDKAEVEEALRTGGARNTAMATSLRATLSIEDRDKVDDEVTKVRQGVLASANRTNVNSFAVSHPSTSTLTAAETASIDAYMASLRPNQARRLSPAARTNLHVVERLSPAQLEDILRNTTDLETTEMRTIRTIVLATGTPASRAYMTTGNSATLWNV